MGGGIKGLIKGMLVDKAHKRYAEKLSQQATDYPAWIRQEEVRSGFSSRQVADGFHFSFTEEEERNGTVWKGKEECGIYFLAAYPGGFAEGAKEQILEEFAKYPNCRVIYGDEDVLTAEGIRQEPWFKPDWAPEDFRSFYYFGGLIAIRSDTVRAFSGNSSLDEFGRQLDAKGVYAVIAKLLQSIGAFSKHGKLYGDNLQSPEVPVRHISEILYHSYGNAYGRACKLREEMFLEYSEKREDFGKVAFSGELQGEEMPSVNGTVSVVIPSKDHPEVLFRCLDSFREKTEIPEGVTCRFIIVDNGSNEENRGRIQEKLKEIPEATYLWEPMDFNFSVMCNKGAAVSEGEYLLFLNDDIEIVETDWLAKLLTMAALPYAGAVGAKLLYPGSDKIQHAGITNLRIGPAHKLQFLSDAEEHYFGRNRRVHDMLGVTAACLMLRRAVFEEVGGFDEKLAVAFNDVDLNYRIYEAGYFNIQRNDVILTHHESLSRGNDNQDIKKQQRLNREKDYLYEKHPLIYGVDPFYNARLSSDVLEAPYAPAYHRIREEASWAKTEDGEELLVKGQEDPCVRVDVEFALDLYQWKYGVARKEKNMEDAYAGWYIQGYSFVIGADNALYERCIVLKNTENGRVYTVTCWDEARPDVAKNAPDQKNIELCGFATKLAYSALPVGKYRIGLYVKDKTSRQRLYHWSAQVVTKEESV